MSPGSKSILDAFRSLLEVNLGLKEDERLLLLGDRGPDGGSAELVEELSSLAETVHPRTETLIFNPAGGHGMEPPYEAWEAAFGESGVTKLEEGGVLGRILRKSGDEKDMERAGAITEEITDEIVQTVVALTHYSTSHTGFRKLLTAFGNARYASMPLFEREMFFTSMDIDWTKLAASTQTLARAMEGADKCEIKSPNGTDLVVGVTGRPVKADDGMLKVPGSFGNLPAGEVFLAPLEGTAEGKLVVEWSDVSKLRSPLTINVKKGRAISVEGDEPEEVRWLDNLFSAHPNNTNIAELGIGTNPGATRPDNVLESEKILGTIHVAFGDNHTFGGVTVAPFHQDFVVFEASLVAVWDRGGGRRVLLTEGSPGWMGM